MKSTPGRLDEPAPSQRHPASQMFSFRLDRDIAERIEQIARKEKVSTNIIGNQALRKYADWDSYALLLGQVAVPKRLLETLTLYLSEEQMRDLGKRLGENWLLETAFALFKNVRLTSLMAVIALTGKYSGTYVTEHTFKDNAHRLILHHNMGPKWSVFYEEFLTRGLRKLLGSSVQIELTRTDNLVLLTVQDSPEVRR